MNAQCNHCTLLSPHHQHWRPPRNAAKPSTLYPLRSPTPCIRSPCTRGTRTINPCRLHSSCTLQTPLRSPPDLTTRARGTRTVFPGLQPPTRSNATPRPRSPPPSTTSPPHPRNPRLHHQPAPAASFLSYPAEPAPARPRIAAKPPTHCRAPLHTTSPHLLACDRPPAPTANHRLRSPPLCRR